MFLTGMTLSFFFRLSNTAETPDSTRLWEEVTERRAQTAPSKRARLLLGDEIDLSVNPDLLEKDEPVQRDDFCHGGWEFCIADIKPN